MLYEASRGSATVCVRLQHALTTADADTPVFCPLCTLCRQGVKSDSDHITIHRKGNQRHLHGSIQGPICTA